MIDQFSDQQKRWVEDYCNETISPEEFAQFEKALEASDTFRVLARQYLAMDSYLYRGAERTILLEDSWADMDQLKPKPKTPWLLWAAAAGIVFLMGLGMGGILNPIDSRSAAAEPEDDGIAILKHAVDAQWATDTESGLVTGSILSTGRLQLESGLAQIEFYNGARLIMEGPVDLELVSVNRAICHHGKLRAHIPPNARGFTVLSSQFELVDLGTEFGIEVGSQGNAKVQVFDGEVELYPPDGNRAPDRLTRLLGGSGLSWNSVGKTTSIDTEPGDFPSFEDVQNRNRQVAERRFGNWEKWNQSVIEDSRIIVHYDFENRGPTLIDRGASGRNGSIIGSEWTSGRWPEKGALEFKRPGDRVRIDVPGEFDALTLTAWIRLDALPDRAQAILLTDGYEIGRPHWQLSPEGNLRLGLRLPSPSKRMKASGYGSPVLFSPRRLGVWSFIATVYDRGAGEVRHYLNGREVSRQDLQSDLPLSIGLAEIGNWGIPLVSNQHPVRNFVGRIDEFTLWSAPLSSEEILDTFRQARP